MALMEYGDYDENQLMSYIQAQGTYIHSLAERNNCSCDATDVHTLIKRFNLLSVNLFLPLFFTTTSLPLLNLYVSSNFHYLFSTLSLLFHYFIPTALHSSRESKLGSQLKESTIRRIIVIVYSLFFFLPPLVYQPLDGGFPLAIKMIQKTNMNVLLSKQNKDALLGNFIKEVTSVYGKDSIVYLAVTPLQAAPIINRVDLFEKTRTNQLRTYEYVSAEINGLHYSTSVIVSLNSEYVQQAGAYLQIIDNILFYAPILLHFTLITFIIIVMN